MAIITDPDDLSQGTSSAETLAWTASSGAQTTLTGTGLPAIAAGEFFEIRDHSTSGNNGLYVESGGSPTTSSVTADKVTGINPVNAGSEAVTWLGDSNSDAKNVHFDTDAYETYLLEQGALSTDGVAKIALHSFAKEEWKSDAFLIAAAPFPMVGISSAAGQWQWGVDPSGNFSGWKLAEDNATHSILSKRLIRSAGWDELDSNGNTKKKYFNVTTLGTFEDTANDLAYYWFGTDATDTGAATDYEFAGPVNEPVLYFDEVTGPDTGTGFAITTNNTITRNDGGNWATDGYVVGGQITIRDAEDAGNNGTFTLTSVSNSADGAVVVSGTPLTNNAADTAMIAAVDNSNVFNTAIRVRDADPNGKTFGQANLGSAGEAEITSKIIKFPLANATDLDISETDANIDANSPYTEVRLRYLSSAYNREVDSVTKRDFGIVVDVGTYSQSNGASASSTLFTSASLSLGSGEALGDYTGGSLIIHEGTDQGTHTISGTPVDNAGTLEITLTSALTATESSLSFTMERATPLTASKNEIYEKVHRELRRDADIDQTGSVVTGRTVDDLMVFVGPDLRCGALSPNNPNGGGSGVIIEGFDTNDTNNLFFFDNGGTSRNFPFVSAGNIVVNQGVVDDTDGEVWLYYEYTNRVTNSDIDVVSPSGDSYDLEGTLGTYVVNDYLWISGFAEDANNGLFIVTAVNASGSDYTVRRVDGGDVGAVETNQTVSVDENPYPSPQAIIVDDNSGADIAFNVGALTTPFDYDYENNTQGGRTADTDAAVVLIAAGHETAQVAVVKGLTITKTTGLTFSVTSAQERNYENA